MESITNVQAVFAPTEIPGSTSLKSGQILFGTVNKIYPNQTAEVQIGQQKMIAQLDVPLQAGERYWLQVQPDEGQIVLKVLDSPNGNFSLGKGATDQLLAHLGFQSEPDSLKLANFLLRNQFPVTKEIFSSSLQWVKEADTTESALSVIKTMFTKQLPFVKDVFFALLEQAKNEPLHKLLSGLQQQLAESGMDTKTVAQLKGVFESLHITKQNQMQHNSLQKLVDTWLGPDPEMKSGAFSLLQKTGFVQKGMGETDFLNKIVAESLTRSVPLKTEAALKLQEGLQSLARAANDDPEARATNVGQPRGVSIEGAGQSLKHAFLGSNQEIKPGFSPTSQAIDNQMVNGAVEQDSRSLKTRSANLQQETQRMTQQQNVTREGIAHLALKLLERACTEVTLNGKMASVNPEVDEILLQLNKDIGQNIESKGKVGDLLLQAFKQTSDVSDPEGRVLTHLMDEGFQMSDVTNAPAFARQLKEWTKMMGLHLEHALGHQAGMEALTEDLETLKPLLLKLLDEQPQATVKELAEQVVNRLTAQQILSQDNGPMQNLLLTLPLNLGSSQTDLTLQWSGRKTKDGKIDPNYCRILFFVELEKLNETIIDMQIQNRVVRVTIVNELSEIIEAAASPYLVVLKDKLQGMDYKLSGVLFDDAVREKKSGQTQSLHPIPDASAYSGVDIRI